MQIVVSIQAVFRDAIGTDLKAFLLCPIGHGVGIRRCRPSIIELAVGIHLAQLHADCVRLRVFACSCAVCIIKFRCASVDVYCTQCFINGGRKRTGVILVFCIPQKVCHACCFAEAFDLQFPACHKRTIKIILKSKEECLCKGTADAFQRIILPADRYVQTKRGFCKLNHLRKVYCHVEITAFVCGGMYKTIVRDRRSGLIQKCCIHIHVGIIGIKSTNAVHVQLEIFECRGFRIDETGFTVSRFYRHPRLILITKP